MEAPQNRRFYEKMECLPLWPTYLGDKWRTLGKTYGINARFYWEHPWETHWEQRKDEKILPVSPNPKFIKKKKTRHLERMLSLPIGYMKFLCSKTIRH